MRDHPNHCSCPRCGSQLPQGVSNQATEFKKAVTVAKLKHRPAGWMNRRIVAQQGFTFAEHNHSKEDWNE